MDDSLSFSLTYEQVDNKLLLLYLINKMDIPLSNSQVSQFILGESVMSYFDLQQCLSDMVELGYLDTAKKFNNTRYSITDSGLTTLEYFEKHIPVNMRNKINKYVLENRKYIKRDYETTANYFKDINTGDYTVKCGIYEDDSMLMEINLTVVSRDHAKMICNNWKSNVTGLYGDILNKLVCPSSIKKEELSATDESIDNGNILKSV